MVEEYEDNNAFTFVTGTNVVSLFWPGMTAFAVLFCHFPTGFMVVSSPKAGACL